MSEIDDVKDEIKEMVKKGYTINDIYAELKMNGYKDSFFKVEIEVNKIRGRL